MGGGAAGADEPTRPLRATPRRSGHGPVLPAGVLTGLTSGHTAARQELFGPVATVFPAADEDDAVRIANDTPYGLGSYVFTTDPEQAPASPTVSRRAWSS